MSSDESQTKIWKDIFGYEGLFKISDSGEIYSVAEDQIINQGSCYPFSTVKLGKAYYVKDLVAHHFLPDLFEGQSDIMEIDLENGIFKIVYADEFIAECFPETMEEGGDLFHKYNNQ